MKAFLVTAGSVFGLIVLVHIVRMSVEPSKVSDVGFWALTLLSGALSVWAFRLFWNLRRS